MAENLLHSCQSGLTSVSVCLCVCIRHHSHVTDLRDLLLETSMKVCRKTPDLVKIGKTTSDTVHKDLSTFYYSRRRSFAIKAFLFSTQYCFIVDSDVYLSNTITHCCLVIPAMVNANALHCFGVRV